MVVKDFFVAVEELIIELIGAERHLGFLSFLFFLPLPFNIMCSRVWITDVFVWFKVV